MTASSAYRASAPAASPGLMASSCFSSSAAGSLWASAPVEAASSKVAANNVTTQKDLDMVFPPVWRTPWAFTPERCSWMSLATLTVQAHASCTFPSWRVAVRTNVLICLPP
jgi:hypothetical protein